MQRKSKLRRSQILPYPKSKEMERMKISFERDRKLRSQRVMQFLKTKPLETRHIWIQLTFDWLTEEDRLSIFNQTKEAA